MYTGTRSTHSGVLIKGGHFGDVSESLRLELNLIMHPAHPKSKTSSSKSSPEHHYIHFLGLGEK